MYLYETHLHTNPVSKCARATVRESLEYYKSAGYTGVFMTDHFIDANIAVEARELPYDEKIRFYFSAYEEGVKIGEEIGLDVFPGFEMSCGSMAHILVYGIDMEWCLAHEDMDKMNKIELMTMMIEDGAFLVQAHPFRTVKAEIRLYPRYVHGVEIFNASRTEFENKLAVQYCENYGLLTFAGSDNHSGGKKTVFGGVATEEKVRDVQHFVEMAKEGKVKPFVRDENGIRYL